jgi:hypothetical protein
LWDWARQCFAGVADASAVQGLADERGCQRGELERLLAIIHICEHVVDLLNAKEEAPDYQWRLSRFGWEH